MARINTEQLRNWQNGDVIPASDYNQERNLIITANNDTNDKANLATINSENAIERVNRLELQPTNVEETSIFQSLTVTLTEGQQTINLPTEYLPNTSRIQVFIDGIYTPVTETSPTSITLQSLARQGQTAVVRWVTELPRVLEIERIEQAILFARHAWITPVNVESELPYPAKEGDTVTVLSTSKVYRYQDGQWLYIMDSPKFPDKGMPNGVAELDETGKVPASQLPDLPSNATDITLTDTADYYTSANVEGALAEIGQTLNGTRQSIISTAQALGVM